MRKGVLACLLTVSTVAFAKPIHIECTATGPTIYKMDGDNAKVQGKGSVTVSEFKDPCGIMSIGKNTRTKPCLIK